eukprot:1227549-Amphidinium_carterae.1
MAPAFPDGTSLEFVAGEPSRPSQSGKDAQQEQQRQLASKLDIAAVVDATEPSVAQDSGEGPRRSSQSALLGQRQLEELGKSAPATSLEEKLAVHESSSRLQGEIASTIVAPAQDDVGSVPFQMLLSVRSEAASSVAEVASTVGDGDGDATSSMAAQDVVGRVVGNLFGANL